MPCHAVRDPMSYTLYPCVLWFLQVSAKLRETNKAMEMLGKAVETEQEAFSMVHRRVTDIMSTFEKSSCGQFDSLRGSLACDHMHVAPRVDEFFEGYKEKVNPSRWAHN